MAPHHSSRLQTLIWKPSIPLANYLPSITIAYSNLQTNLLFPIDRGGSKVDYVLQWFKIGLCSWSCDHQGSSFEHPNLFCWLYHDYFGQTLLQLKHLCSEKLHFYTTRVINSKSQLPYPKPYSHLLKGLHPRVEKVFIKVVFELLLIV